MLTNCNNDRKDAASWIIGEIEKDVSHCRVSRGKRSPRGMCPGGEERLHGTIIGCRRFHPGHLFRGQASLEVLTYVARATWNDWTQRIDCGKHKPERTMPVMEWGKET